MSMTIDNSTADYTRFGADGINNVDRYDSAPIKAAEDLGDLVRETVTTDLAKLGNEVENLGRLVIDLQQGIENRQQVKIEAKLSEIDTLHAKIDDLTTFVEHLENELAFDKKTVDFSQHQELIDKVKVHLPHELLNKSTWTKAEAEALSKAFSRRVEQVSREINPLMTKVNHLMEDRHEMLQLIREILKMYREMVQGMTRNQVSR